MTVVVDLGSSLQAKPRREGVGRQVDPRMEDAAGVPTGMAAQASVLLKKHSPPIRGGNARGDGTSNHSPADDDDIKRFRFSFHVIAFHWRKTGFNAGDRYQSGVGIV